MIRAVLFDYGMVLSGPADALQRKRMEDLLRVDSESFGEAYWKFRDAYDRGTLTAEAYWSEVAGALGRDLEAVTLKGLIEADTLHWAKPNAPMIAWAAALQSAGMKTGILSNLGDAMELGLHARHAWLNEFTHKTFSHRLGIAKPDAAIYRHAVNGLGVLPSEVLFIDDRVENILAARTAGMIALQYVDHDAFVEELSEVSFPQGVPTLARS
jgi:putative hydrolase of the HAD superfamily